jgi:hypothetical protein
VEKRKLEECIPRDVLEEIEDAGLSREEITRLLGEMEMCDENGEDLLENEMGVHDGREEQCIAYWMEIVLAKEQECGGEGSSKVFGDLQQGYVIPEAIEQVGLGTQ